MHAHETMNAALETADGLQVPRVQSPQAFAHRHVKVRHFQNPEESSSHGIGPAVQQAFVFGQNFDVQVNGQ